LEFRILGRLEVHERGEPLPLGGTRQRALLALLVLRRRETVSLDRIIDELWGESCPPTAAKTVQVYVSRLRKLLGDGVIETRGHGYRLMVDAEQTDIDRFQRLGAQARAALEAGDVATAAAAAESALAVWRGQPLEEVSAAPFAPAAMAELEEARLSVLEHRIEAQLQLGQGAGLTDELQRLVAEHPLRERLTAGLMLALYRSGRQAEALAAHRRTRAALDEQLGLAPGPELRELERRILVHDPSLQPPARPGPTAGTRRRAGRWGLVALAAPVAAVAVLLALLFTARARPREQALEGASGVVAIDASSARTVAARPIDASLDAMSSGAGAIWVADPGSGSVLRLDPRSGSVADRIHVGGEPGALAVGAGSVWAASTIGGRISRIAPATGAVTQVITLPGAHLAAIAYGDGRLWAADSVAHTLFEIDVGSGRVRDTIPLDVEPSAVLVAAGRVWIAGYDRSSVLALDPRSGRLVGRVRVGDGPVALAEQGGSIWAANSLDATVSRWDPGRLGRPVTIPVGSGPSAVIADGGSVWVADEYANELARIDPRSDRVSSRIALGGPPGALVADGGRVWAGVDASAAAHRGGTVTLVTTQRFGSLDPAVYDVASSPQFIGLAYDSLVSFDHGAGADGLRLVPDLALAVPRAVDGGRTYRFQLRPGIRYANGAPLRAADFRRGIERLFGVGSPQRDRFAGLIGGAACQAHPRRCDLSQGIVTDERARTVVFRFRAPQPDFLFDLALEGFAAPVPAGVAPGERPPGTGPYRIASVGPDTIRLDRNPYFREWSHAAQPAGNPDALVWRFVSSTRAAVNAVTSGHADWFFGLLPRDRYRRLAIRAPAQLHVSPMFAVDFVPLNTHRAPFDDVRVRRALNDAIDRRRIVRMYGGPEFATATCQPLTPGLPGYRRYCPFGRPSPAGAALRPDLARARKLVRESGTRGERIELWGSSDESYMPRGLPEYVAGVLRSLGYRVRVQIAPQASISESRRRRLQLSVDGDWLAEYPDPASYLPSFFGCHGETSNGYFCAPALDREMARASALRAAHPRRSAALWTAVDHRLTRAAPWVPTVNEREVDLVSRRLHDYAFNPVWGFMPDQSWVR
jgi:ABC-type transport system substrate-binding protein/DNA-binding SARP family transcriptional activator